jgi:aminoglycoside phosphotransferase
MAADGNVPHATLATEIAAQVTGRRPSRVTRFTTGVMHYVFEASFADGPPIVVRIAGRQGVAAMRSAAKLSHQLRPLGVGLPAILAEDLDAQFPWLALERLAGTDLGNVVANLDAPRLDAVAREIAHAQAIVATIPSAGRYGYAADPAEAPHRRWSDVVLGHLERSCDRMAAAGLFGPEPAAAAAGAVESVRAELDAIAATPFLHDTTTRNVIVTTDGALSGIVDVDDLCFGDPRYVVALTAASLLNLGCGKAYTDAWLRHAGLADDRLFRLYISLFLLDFMAEHGTRFNGNEAPSSPEARTRLRALFDESLRQASS